MKKLFILFISVFALSLAQAQVGTLRGKIIDQKTGETLIGAAVTVAGTSQGTITDFDGNYSFELAAGTYEINFSFISYETQRISAVVIKAGQVTIQNANLGDANMQLQEVVVTAKANNRTESALMVMQRKSAKIVDGISSQQISRLGDSDAASALKRVTGVSVQGGKYVFVRGLGDRYVKTTLNNADIPALDPERNSVQMDLFPSNIIENIVVNKTFTPDMPGEATGGHIDVVTRDFPEQFTLQVSSSYSYNPISSLNKNFISSPAGKYDWLGMDGGARAIPAVAQSYIDKLTLNKSVVSVSYFNATDLNKFSNSFQNNMVPEQSTSGIDFSQKVAVGNQISLGGDKALGFNMALGYSQDYDYREDGVSGTYATSDLTQDRVTTDRVGSKNVKLYGLLNLNLKLSNNHKIGLRVLRNQSGSQITSLRDGTDVSETLNIQERNLNYQGRLFTTVQLHGKHYSESLGKTSVTWLGSYTDMNQDEPDSRFFTNYYTPGATPNFEIKSINAPSRIYRYMNEKDLDFKVDLETSLPLFGTKTKAKYGAAFSNKQRAGQQYKFSVAGISSSFYDGEFSLDGNLGNYIPSNLISTDNPTGIYYSFDLKDSKIGSYTASSNLVAGYAMLDIPVSEKFRVVAGARVEYYMVSVSNNIPKNFSEWKGNDETEMNVLPSLNLTYSLTENTNLRLAASQTVSRPVFREIAPQSFYDYRDAIRYTGNPNLKSCNISNLDLRFEHYFERGEMFALSGFYKYFNAPIERRLDPGSQNPEIVYFNSTASNLFGIEAEFRKGLGFMKLKDFSIGANCTFVHSSIALNAQESLDQQRSTRPMNGQAPYVINTYLSFDNEASKINANLSFNISGEKMWLINSRSTPYVYEMPRAMLNFNIGKGIGEHWSVDFSVDNILNAQSRNAYLGNNNTDATFLGYYSGRSYQIGFKYAIK